jgi:hypothetical protein
MLGAQCDPPISPHISYKCVFLHMAGCSSSRYPYTSGIEPDIGVCFLLLLWVGHGPDLKRGLRLGDYGSGTEDDAGFPARTCRRRRCTDL